MGGSILPVTIHNNKIYFLFGKERDIDENPGWSDFGGGTDKGETFIQTAVREGGEELTGFLGTDSDLKKMLQKYGTYNIDYKSQGYSTYRCHIFPMDYDPMLPHYYNNNQVFLQKHLDAKIIKNTKIFEKTQIKWFSFDDIKRHHNEFRSFYKNIVQLIIDNKLAIEKFVRGKNTTKKYTFKKSITKNTTKNSKKGNKYNKSKKNRHH
jgi:8-oxo-dGTP pyrophosphatase MutT (NUDIX family)